VDLEHLALPPVLSIEELLNLDKLGIEYVADYPDGGAAVFAGLEVRHGDIARAAPGATAGAIVRQAGVSTAFGHIHRKEMATVNLGCREITAFCPGCICHTDHRVPGHKRGQHWQQGAALVEFDTEAGIMALTMIEVSNGKAIFNGVMLSGADCTTSLRQLAPDWNW